MRDFLLDTNVVSASAPTKAARDSRLRHWVEARSSRLHLSAVTVAELSSGCAKLARESPGRRAAALQDWFRMLVEAFSDRIQPIDASVAELAGRLLDQAVGRGHDPGFPDALIAATAHRHDLHLVTRNVRHFRCFDLEPIDPLMSSDR